MDYLRVFALLVLVNCFAIDNNNNNWQASCHLELLDPSTSDRGAFIVSNNNDKQQQISHLKNVELEGLTQEGQDMSPAGYAPPGSCQLVHVVHLLRHAGCQPKAIASFACSGRCSSYVQTSTSKFWQHERSCSCCQQMGSQEATFTLDCPSLDPPYKKVKTHAPVECLCRSCVDATREDLRPHELVEALAGEPNNGRQRR